MKIKESLGSKIFNGFNVLILSFITFVTLYPILHVIFASFSDGNKLLAHIGVLWAPIDFNINAYMYVFKDDMILRGYMNTIIIVGTTLLINIVLTSFAAYFMTRKQAYGRNFVTFFMMVTMYFSGGIVPLYFTIMDLGLYNSWWAIILTAGMSTYNTIILRTAFASVPESLVESAQIDGAGHFTTLFKIVLPLSKATLAVIILYYLVAHWNSWFHASLFLRDKTKRPLQLMLREILIEASSGEEAGVQADQAQAVSETVKYAIIVVASFPVMCIYPFLQKYFAKGAMIGAVKG